MNVIRFVQLATILLIIRSATKAVIAVFPFLIKTSSVTLHAQPSIPTDGTTSVMMFALLLLHFYNLKYATLLVQGDNTAITRHASQPVRQLPLTPISTSVMENVLRLLAITITLFATQHVLLPILFTMRTISVKILVLLEPINLETTATQDVL